MVLDIIDDEKLHKYASKGNQSKSQCYSKSMDTANNPTFWKPWFVSLMRILLLIVAMAWFFFTNPKRNVPAWVFLEIFWKLHFLVFLIQLPVTKYVHCAVIELSNYLRSKQLPKLKSFQQFHGWLTKNKIDVHYQNNFWWRGITNIELRIICVYV